ncbi:unnamed protein product, partial [marine sediment metagenome]
MLRALGAAGELNAENVIPTPADCVGEIPRTQSGAFSHILSC